LADWPSQPSPSPGPARTPSAPRAAASPPAVTGARLTLPPGLVQELPIDPDASYMGQAVRAAHTRIEKSTLFGGACIAHGHLHGKVRIAFSEPEDDIAHFDVAFGELIGEDSVFAAPQLFKMPALMNTVTDASGVVSSGDLNLATGEVSNLGVSAS